jgi:RNase P/RNase MRP subunit p29
MHGTGKPADVVADTNKALEEIEGNVNERNANTFSARFFKPKKLTVEWKTMDQVLKMKPYFNAE